MLRLVSEDSTCLRTRNTEIDIDVLKLGDVAEEVKACAKDMQETRRAYKAVGLAANQCGLAWRMFVMGTDFAEFVCINPEIIEYSEEIECKKEGCLSFQHLSLAVKRPRKIKVRYYDQDFELVECEFEGLLARCFQHELDHLNGITFTSKVSNLRLKMAEKKRKKKR